MAAVLGILVVLLCMIFSQNDNQQIPTKESSNDDNMVYFDVNSQNSPEIQPPQSESQIDETELNADQYNQEMAQTLTQKPSVNLPKEEETFIIPESPKFPHYKKHHARRTPVKATSYGRVAHHQKPCGLERIFTPSKRLLSKVAPKVMRQLPFVGVSHSATSILAVKLDYANAYEVADFINKNLPCSARNVATAKGGSEIILHGSDKTIDTAQKIITLLDTHPKVAVFKLNYTKPYRMANMLANSVFGGDCNVFAEGDEKPSKTSPFAVYYNNAQNSITLVGATSKQMDMAQEFINFSDVKSPQAFLDIMFVEFNENGSRQFQKLSQFNATSASDCEVTNQNIYSLITNIISCGGGKILAKPRLTIANDSDYNINVTSDYVKSRQSKYVYNIEDCGTRLKIHSVINPKGEVFLTLEPHYITVKRAIPNERNAKATLFNRKCFRYENVKLVNRQTLCFGGVNSQQEYMSFGRKKTVNTELMMFVNVHVLD